MKSNSKKYKLWFCSEKPLYELAEILLKNEVIGAFDYDYENVYEWLEAQSKIPSVELNISRKHSFSKGFEEGSENEKKSNLEEHITFMFMYDDIEPSDLEVEKLANKISLVLKTQLYLGTVNYLGGDDYEYLKIKEI